jgi:hypothetical protein
MTIRPFLHPVDAVKEGIFPDYYQVSIYWGIYSIYNLHTSVFGSDLKKNAGFQYVIFPSKK